MLTGPMKHTPVESGFSAVSMPRARAAARTSSLLANSPMGNSVRAKAEPGTRHRK